MSHVWYYADRSNQRRGPVDDNAIAAALARGEVDDATLVWREGYADWVPLAKARAELGLPAASARAATPVGAKPRIVQPTGRSNTWVIVLVVVGLGVLFVGGILAAIAIPAYADYTTRARVAEAINTAAPVKLAMSEEYLSSETCGRNGDGSIDTAESYATPQISAIHAGEIDGRCTIAIVFKSFTSAIPEGAEVVLTLEPDGMTWTPSSTLPSRYLPASMRR